MLDRYDAGLLNDYGGGNVEWWQDYIRAELERAHDFYTDQVEAALTAALAAKDAELAAQIEARDIYRRDFHAAISRAERAEAQLTEANKVLDRIIDIHVRNFGRQDEKIADILPIARRAREAQGGENG